MKENVQLSIPEFKYESMATPFLICSLKVQSFYEGEGLNFWVTIELKMTDHGMNALNVSF